MAGGKKGGGGGGGGGGGARKAEAATASKPRPVPSPASGGSALCLLPLLLAGLLLGCLGLAASVPLAVLEDTHTAVFGTAFPAGKEGLGTAHRAAALLKAQLAGLLGVPLQGAKREETDGDDGGEAEAEEETAGDSRYPSVLAAQRRTRRVAEQDAAALKALEKHPKRNAEEEVWVRGQVRVAAAVNNDYTRGEKYLESAGTPEAAAQAQRGLEERLACPRFTGSGDASELYSCDGVQDCCDGRDEKGCPEGAGSAAKVVDTCQAFVREKVANELFTIKKVVAGLKAKQGIVQDRGLPWDHFTSHIAKVSEEFEARKEQFNAMVSSPDADESVLVPYYHQLMADGQRIEQLNNFREPHFAPDLVLLPLLGACTHFEGNERNTKGGSAEPVAHDFNFTVCLFDRVTQQELPEKATPTQKPGGSDFDDDDAVDEPGYGGAEAQPSEGAAAPEEKQPVLLGSFQGLQERVLPATDNRNPQNRTVQVYAGGAPCFEGPEREVLIALECDTEFRVVSVLENGKCAYEIVVGTPLVCQHAELYRLQEGARSLLDNAWVTGLIGDNIP